MTVYNTTDLAIAIIGEDEVSSNRKNATRTLRKFLRDDMGEGKAVVGKGGRYALELKAQELRNMKKRFAAWEKAQEEAKAARAELRATTNSVAPAEAIILPQDDPADDEALLENELSDEGDIEGPSDEEIAAMLSED